MQKKVLTQTVVLGLLATLTWTGCKNGRWFWQKPKPPVASTTGGVEQPVPPIAGSDINTTGPRPIITGSNDLIHGQYKPVYFDYDSAKIKPSELAKLQPVVDALKSNTKKLLVEGHCDERGTAEYNRALGERRAQSARDELVRLGVDASRISTISYGKERPIEPLHNDDAWSKNRRCEFVILSQ